MNRHPRALVAAAAALVALLPAACGDGTTEAAPAKKPAGASFDRALHDLLPQSVRDKGVIVVGTDASYAPMSFFGPDGRTIVGMEPDLAAAVGTVLGVPLKFENVDFTEILPRVEKGTLDLGVSAMTDTTEREKAVDFVNYFSAGTSIVVQRGNPTGITDVKDLCGKVVAVEEGTTQVDLMQRSQANCTTPIKLKTFPTNSDALVQLRTGRAAAVLNDFPPASYLSNDARTKSHYQLASTTQYEPGLYGMAVSKEQTGLRDAVEGALEQLVRDGGYRTVLQQWNVQAGGVDEVTINSGR
ncbi:ABC transporter substrate-binding protein [Angustibacter peucedani]